MERNPDRGVPATRGTSPGSPDRASQGRENRSGGGCWSGSGIRLANASDLGMTIRGVPFSQLHVRSGCRGTSKRPYVTLAVSETSEALVAGLQRCGRWARWRRYFVTTICRGCLRTAGVDVRKSGGHPPRCAGARPAERCGPSGRGSTR